MYFVINTSYKLYMDENLEILVRGEITYLPQNVSFMILVDDSRDKYKKTPTLNCLKECVINLKNYITKYDDLVKTDLRLLNAIIAYRKHILLNVLKHPYNQ